MKNLITELELSHDHYSLDSTNLQRQLVELANHQKHYSLMQHINTVLRESDLTLDPDDFVSRLRMLHFDVSKLSTKRTERLRYRLQTTLAIISGITPFFLVSCGYDINVLFGVTVGGSLSLATYIVLESLWNRINPYHLLLRKLALYIQTHTVLLIFQFKPINDTTKNLPMLSNFWCLTHYICRTTTIAIGKVAGLPTSLLAINKGDHEEIAFLIDLPTQDQPCLYAYSSTKELPRFIFKNKSSFYKSQCHNHVSQFVNGFTVVTHKNSNVDTVKLCAKLSESLSFLFFELPHATIESNGRQLLISTREQLIPKLNFADSQISDVEVCDHLHDPVTVEQLKIYPIISNLIINLCKFNR